MTLFDASHSVHEADGEILIGPEMMLDAKRRFELWDHAHEPKSKPRVKKEPQTDALPLFDEVVEPESPAKTSYLTPRSEGDKLTPGQIRGKQMAQGLLETLKQNHPGLQYEPGERIVDILHRLNEQIQINIEPPK